MIASQVAILEQFNNIMIIIVLSCLSTEDIFWTCLSVASMINSIVLREIKLL